MRSGSGVGQGWPVQGQIAGVRRDVQRRHTDCTPSVPAGRSIDQPLDAAAISAGGKLLAWTTAVLLNQAVVTF